MAKATREAVVLLEAAGFDVILIETVGVGQSEVAVANMVDTFVLLTLARTGDQLQGIKKGVLELADIVVVNKADGEHLREAKCRRPRASPAIRLIYPRETLWRPPVLTMSAMEGTGLTELWETVERHREVLTEAGEFEARRRDSASRLDLADGPRHGAGPGAVQPGGAQDPRRRGAPGPGGAS